MTFLSTTSTFVLEALFSGRLLVYQWAPISFLIYLFLHTFEYDFLVKTMKQDITKAIQFNNTIDDLFSINNVDFGNYISVIYPSELQLTDTSTSSTEVCYLDTNIKTGGTNTPFRISIYDKRDDLTFRQLSSYGQQHSRPSSLRCLYISTGGIC